MAKFEAQKQIFPMKACLQKRRFWVSFKLVSQVV
jgi:hypothetical protein